MPVNRRFKQQLAGRNRKTAKALVGHKALYDLLTIIQQTGQEIRLMKVTWLKSFPPDHPIYLIGAVVGGVRTQSSASGRPSQKPHDGITRQPRNHEKQRR